MRVDSSGHRAATIYDVARAAGVAPSTVSRALTRPGRISSKTAQRVIDAAEQLGYQANKTARSLSTGHTGNLAMVIPDIGNPFFTDLMRAFHAGANARGYSVFLIDTGETGDLEAQHLAKLLTQSDGVLLVSPRMSADDLTALVATGRFVLVNRVADGAPVVRIDSSQALEEALDDLRDAGHQSLIYVRGPAHAYSDEWRRKIVRSAARRRAMALAMTHVQESEASAAAEALQLAHAHGATAIVAHSDSVAVEILSQCRQQGIAVPGALSVVGHDNIRLAEVTVPALTTIDAQTHLAGRVSADLLVALVERRESRQDETIALQAAYVKRESSGPPARARLSAAR